VHLHGRLFMQWLHHLFPRQCSYPHVAGSTSPQLPEAFEKETGLSCMETQDEMRKFIETAGSLEVPTSVASEGLWEPQEELLAGQPQVGTTKQALAALVKQLVAPERSTHVLGAAAGAAIVSVLLMAKLIMGIHMSSAAQMASSPLLAI